MLEYKIYVRNEAFMKEILSEIFGSQLKKFKTKEINLPVYLMDGRTFYDVNIMDTDCVLVYFQKYNQFSITSLKKQMINYNKFFDRAVVYGFDSITTFQRKALVENGISFVSNNGQVFMPFIGTLFYKCVTNQMDNDVLRFMPVTQSLFLFLLYNEDDKKINKSQAAEILGVTPMSITRAVKELKQLGIVEETKVGTQIKVSRNLSRFETYEKAKDYLINPIQRIVYILKKDFINVFPSAGEYSLCERSELSYPRYEEYALSKEAAEKYILKEIDPNTVIDSEIVKIQIWKYNPALFANGDVIDPVSLISSFSENKDERIQMCIEEVEKEINTWQM